jgi:hypothetical protein
MISVILLILAGIFNACMDTLKTHYSNSIFARWGGQHWINPSLSWANKWKYKSKILDLIMSTIFVCITDFWHFCKFLMLSLIMASIIFYSPLINRGIDFLILYCSFTIPFEIFYSNILIKNK